MSVRTHDSDSTYGRLVMSAALGCLMATRPAVPNSIAPHIVRLERRAKKTQLLRELGRTGKAQEHVAPRLHLAKIAATHSRPVRFRCGPPPTKAPPHLDRPRLVR